MTKKLVRDHQKIGRSPKNWSFIRQKIGHWFAKILVFHLPKFWSFITKILVIICQKIGHHSPKFWSFIYRSDDQKFGPYNIEPELYIYQNESNGPDTRNNTVHSVKQRQRPFKNIKRIVFVSSL